MQVSLTAFSFLVLRFNATLPQNNPLQSRSCLRRYTSVKEIPSIVKALVVLLILVFVQGCSVNEPRHQFSSAFEPKVVIIPKETFIQIQENNSLTVAEAKKIEASYTTEVTDRILAEVSELSDEMYFVCGGVYWEENPEYLNSMQLIGITEKWIPINGTVTKVLHFKLRK